MAKEKKYAAQWGIIIVIILVLIIIFKPYTTADEKSIYDKFQEKYQKAKICSAGYNQLVETINKQRDIRKEYDKTKVELIDQSRICEQNLQESRLFLEDNSKTIKTFLENNGNDYYEVKASLDREILFYRESRNNLQNQLW